MCLSSLSCFCVRIADYHRYLAEFSIENDQDRTEASVQALAAYCVATEIAKTHLTPSHPVRLGLALNFSVFYYEIMSQPDRQTDTGKRRQGKRERKKERERERERHWPLGENTVWRHAFL